MSQCNWGSVVPREPTQAIRRPGGPGRRRMPNPLIHVYEAALTAPEYTVECDIPAGADIQQITRLLYRVASWHRHGKPQVRVDDDAGIFQVTVRPNKGGQRAAPA